MYLRIRNNESTSANADTAARPAKIGRTRWTILALLFLATTINYIDRQVIRILKPTPGRAIVVAPGSAADREQTSFTNAETILMEEYDARRTDHGRGPSRPPGTADS